MIIVYQHRRLDTKEIFYIGIGNNIKIAYNKNNNRNNYWKNIINKTNYSVEILHDNLTWKEACLKLNLKYTTTRAQITGQNPNKTTLKYNQ